MRILVSIIALLALYVAMASLMSMDELLDARFYYSATEASKFFAALTPANARIYFEHQLLDLLFLSAYSVLSFSMIEILFPKSSTMKIFAVVPGIFDFIETIAVIAALVGVPTTYIVGWLGYATCLKWVSGSILLFVSLPRMILAFSRLFTAVT